MSFKDQKTSILVDYLVEQGATSVEQGVILVDGHVRYSVDILVVTVNSDKIAVNIVERKNFDNIFQKRAREAQSEFMKRVGIEQFYVIIDSDSKLFKKSDAFFKRFDEAE